MKTFILGLTVVLSFQFAQAGKFVRLVEKQPAPFAGVLLDRDAENQVNIAFESNEQMRENMSDQFDMIQNLHKQKVNFEEQNAILKDELDRSQSFLWKAIWFLGGAFVGGMVVKTVNDK